MRVRELSRKISCSSLPLSASYRAWNSTVDSTLSRSFDRKGKGRKAMT